MSIRTMQEDMRESARFVGTVLDLMVVPTSFVRNFRDKEFVENASFKQKVNFYGLIGIAETARACGYYSFLEAAVQYLNS